MEYKMKLWIARDKDDALWIFNGKPQKYPVLCSWNSPSGAARKLPKKLFPRVKWEDKKPTKVELTINMVE